MVQLEGALGSQPAVSEAGRSWRTQQEERLWLVSLGCLLGGLLLFMADGWLLEPAQINVLGLTLLVAASGSLMLTSHRLALAVWVLLGGLALAVALAVRWLPGHGIAALYLLPVGLAAWSQGPRAGLVAGLAVTGLLLVQPSAIMPGLAVGELSAALLLVNLTWISAWFGEAEHEAAYGRLFSQYRQTQALLEEARDQRLLLNQANEDLAEAYAQVARLNELLRTSQVEVEQARRAKEGFVANVSHELRTPLNMIIGFSEMILNAPAAYQHKASLALLADMGVIYRNSQHLQQLINDVLDLSQIDAGQFTIQREWVDLAAIVREALEAVDPLYHAKGLTLKSELEPELPLVRCDRLRIRQILLNLLSNAGRFTTIGGVTVAVRAGGDAVTVSVCDTGSGVAPDEQRRIFEPFQQLDASTRRQHGGSGLGLSICRRLVELHGGRMGIESAVGVGSTFFFSLPLEVEADASPSVGRWFNQYAPYAPRTRRPVIEIGRPPAQIVVLEQGDTLQRQVSTHLSEVETVGVRTVAELSQLLTTTAPSLILVNDAQVMEDWRLIRRLLPLPARTPVISCFAPGLPEACEQLHVAAYLIKPVTREALLAAVARVAPPTASLLVVEDNSAVAHLVARQLASANLGYRLLRASSGERALEMMRQAVPDAVLLDLGLPDQDGYQVLQAKNGDPALRAIPVLIVSARDPLGEPVVTNRLRVEMAGGLSVRDILLSAAAISQALSPMKRLRGQAPPETPVG